MFLHPRKSQIDVVQSVGRVMRRAPGKKMGYVILPVGVPAGVPPEQALNDNEKYKVVWQILNALRAHDDRFDATINKASLGQDVSGNIEIIGVSGTQSEELEARHGDRSRPTIAQQEDWLRYRLRRGRGAQQRRRQRRSANRDEFLCR